MYEIIKRQTTSVYKDFNKSNLDWSNNRRSHLIGVSCMAFIVPTIFLSRNTYLQILLEFLFYFQTIIAFASDWYYSGVDHWIHGLDRAHATIFFIFKCLLTVNRIHIFWPIVSTPALYYWYMGKKAVKEKNWDDYVFYHSMWHGVGAGIICPISTWLADY